MKRWRIVQAGGAPSKQAFPEQIRTNSDSSGPKTGDSGAGSGRRQDRSRCVCPKTLPPSGAAMGQAMGLSPSGPQHMPILSYGAITQEGSRNMSVSGSSPPHAGATAALPALSLIIPVFQGWHDLPVLLGALEAQSFQDFEILIADNEPSPYPDHAFQALVPVGLAGRVLHVHCARPGSYAARNAAAAQARAPRLVFTDADCHPLPGWLAALMAAADRHPAALLAGPIRMTLCADPGMWEIYDALRGIPQARYVAHGYATTANLSVPHPLFKALSGFDPRRLSGGDAEFCRRAGRQGAALHLVPEAIILHPARSSRAECVTKIRRIKGGQLTVGPLRQRLIWTIRSLTPPLREMMTYLRNRDFPVRWRWIACAARARLWGTELAEMARILILRASPERR